jgi:hypothetical protein
MTVELRWETALHQKEDGPAPSGWLSQSILSLCPLLRKDFDGLAAIILRLLHPPTFFLQ